MSAPEDTGSRTVQDAAAFARHVAEDERERPDPADYANEPDEDADDPYDGCGCGAFSCPCGAPVRYRD